MSWKIASWDRAQGTGTIVSGLGTLPFDAAVAMTDDFRFGEEVAVLLRPEGGTYVVTRIHPVAWHAPPAPERVVVLPPELADAVNGRTLALRSVDEDAQLTVTIVAWSGDEDRQLVFHGCVFVQLPSVIEDVATISAYAAADFEREVPELARHWPALPPTACVYRIEPLRFGATPGYVVALAVRVVG